MALEVLFVCIHNAGRSRIAEAFYNSLSGDGLALSAGTIPADRPHPEVVEAMKEVGIDIPISPGRLLTIELLESSTRVITMGCDVDEACPGAIYESEDWGLEDPKGKSPKEVREIRDEIKDRVKILIQQMEEYRPDQLRPPTRSSGS